MALQGKFVINDANFSPLMFYGVGTFMAFSGSAPYRNHGACAMIPRKGPVPEGKYWIVARPAGGPGSKAITWLKDAFNSLYGNNTVPHAEWFALYRDDGVIDDYTWIESVRRGAFRLHPGTLSEGCITLAHVTDFITIRKALLRAPTVAIHSTGLQAFGTIDVEHTGAKNCL